MALFVKFYDFRTKLVANFVDVLSFLHVRIYLLAIISLNSLIWIAIYYLRLNLTDDLVILHYKINFGIDLIGSKDQLFIIPIVSVLIMLVNLILVFWFGRKKQFVFISHLLLATCVLINIFFLLSIASIYLINFR